VQIDLHEDPETVGRSALTITIHAIVFSGQVANDIRTARDPRDFGKRGDDRSRRFAPLAPSLRSRQRKIWARL